MRIHSCCLSKNLLLSVCLVIGSISLATAAPAGQIYKWVDKDGNVHFSDKPVKDENGNKKTESYQPSRNFSQNERIAPKIKPEVEHPYVDTKMLITKKGLEQKRKEAKSSKKSKPPVDTYEARNKKEKAEEAKKELDQYFKDLEAAERKRLGITRRIEGDTVGQERKEAKSPKKSETPEDTHEARNPRDAAREKSEEEWKKQQRREWYIEDAKRQIEAEKQRNGE